MASEAGRLVAELVAAGMSKAAIARALGRNSSLISQISKGRKPGTAYESALRELRAGRTPAPPPRRLTRAGTPAQVRHGAVGRGAATRPVRGPVRGGVGTNYAGKGTGTGQDIGRFLGRAAQDGARVTITATFRNLQRYGQPAGPGSIVIFAKGGMDAGDALADWQAGQSQGSSPAAMVAGWARMMPGTTAASGLVDVQIAAHT